MGACEPGQGGNAAAISNTFMCPGEPPRLSPAPADRYAAATAELDPGRRCDVLSTSPCSGTRSAPVAPGPGSKKRSSSTPTSRAGASRTPARATSVRPSPSRDRLVTAPPAGPRRTTRSSPGAIGPQRFEDVVGQDHVVQALRNAIRLNRVTHAYLFCGTRGVGKTSMARIFAKCLNCVHGPTEEPCQVCDICQAIAVGPGRRRHRDRRGQQQRRRAGPRAPPERRRSGPAGPGSRSTTSTKSTCSRPGPSTPC